jgi:hypothetical protein
LQEALADLKYARVSRFEEKLDGVYPQTSDYGFQRAAILPYFFT